MKQILRILPLLALVLVASCNQKHKFSEADLQIIYSNPDSLLHIYTIDDPKELEVLRTPSVNLTRKTLHSEDFKVLSERMLKTVAAADGLGLAAPQIGINKAVVAVKRMDKEGEPYEIYPNLVIREFSEEMGVSIEECLSLPEKSGYVDRYQVVVIEYYNIPEKKIARDTISTYASVLFQHEVDHLDGILFTDRSW